MVLRGSRADSTAGTRRNGGNEPMGQLIQELRRRNVIRVAIAYAISAWLLIQISDTVFPILNLPEWSVTLVTVLILIGFPVALIFAWAFELTPEGIKLEKHVVRDESTTHETGRKLDFVIIAMLVAALGYFGYDKFVLDPSRDAELVQATTDAITEQAGNTLSSGIPDKSIAVLPFRNRSAIAEDAYFVDGIHDDILTQLSKLSSLGKVISRTSMERYRDTEKSMPQIGEELGVATILEGSVQRSGDHVRLNMQLIDAQADEHLWAETYDRQLTAENLFAIQSEIAREIAAALHIVLTDQENDRLQTLPTDNLEAYGEYVLGRQAASKRTAETVKRARVHFENAIELDTEYALAYIGLADSAYLQAAYADLLRTETYAVRQAAIDKALTLDPLSGEAYTSLAALKSDKKEAAEKYYLKAIELSPNYSTAYQWYSNYLRKVGRQEEALQLIRKALELDPLEPILTQNLSRLLLSLGRVEEAQSALLKGVERIPEFPGFYVNMADQLRRLGRVGEAMRWAHAGAGLDTSTRATVWWECDIYLDLGDDQSSERCAKSAVVAFPNTQLAMANLHLFRSEYQQVVELLEQRLRQNPTTGYKFNLAGAYLINGEAGKARSIWQELVPDLYGDESVLINPSELSQTIFVAYTLYVNDEQDRANYLFDQALEIMQSMHRTRGRGYLVWDVFIHATRGNKQKAISALRDAINTGWRQDWWYYPRFPAFDSIRGEPEWIELMNELEADIVRQRQWYEDHKDEPLFD